MVKEEHRLSPLPSRRRAPTARACCLSCATTALTPEMRTIDPSPSHSHEPIVASLQSAFLELCPMVAVVDVIQPTKVAHRNAIAGALGLAERDHRGSDEQQVMKQRTLSGVFCGGGNSHV